MLDVANYGNIKVVHISKDKQTIFEYIRENEMGTSLFSVGCIFKSFLSVLVGVAIFVGYVVYNKLHATESRFNTF